MSCAEPISTQDRLDALALSTLLLLAFAHLLPKAALPSFAGRFGRTAAPHTAIVADTTSGSSTEDGSGEAYYYEGDGSLYFLFHEGGNIAQNENSQGDSEANPGAITLTGSRSYASSFSYDGAGNRTQANNGGAVTNYTPDGEDRQVGYNNGYDGNQDQTNTPDGWIYSYCAGGLLRSADNSGTGAHLDFAYDALGRVCSRHVGTALTCFYYAGAQRIEERSGTGLTSLYRYYYDRPGSDRLLCRVDAANTHLYYLQDARGYTSHLADASGNIVEQYLYDAFGTPKVYDVQGNPRTGNLSAYDNRYLFNSSSGYEWLPTGNIFYARARYYAPNQGRWLTPDPSGFAGGDINLYRYCGNDPVNDDDPTGLYTIITLYDTVPFGAGHIGIETSPSANGDGSTYGFFHASGLSGDVEADSDKPWDSLTLQTTAAQERAINNYIQQVMANPGMYDPSGEIGNNCADFVYQALQKAGLSVRSSVIPVKLFHHIKRDLRKLVKQNKKPELTPAAPEPNSPNTSTNDPTWIDTYLLSLSTVDPSTADPGTVTVGDPLPDSGDGGASMPDSGDSGPSAAGDGDGGGPPISLDGDGLEQEE